MMPMPTIISTPAEITEVLFEGDLEPDAPVGRSKGRLTAGQYPSVALGRPACLGQFGVDFAAPRNAKALLKQSDYYLVRLGCSFRPPHEGILTFATLSAYLRPTVGSVRVTAFDLFPKQVQELQEGETIVGVVPGLGLRAVAAASEEEASWREYLSALRQILATRFSDGELRTLCSDLGVDYESLPGQGKADKARELINHLERRQRIAALVAIGRRQRPDVAWDAALEATGVETLIKIGGLEPIVVGLGVQRSDPGWEFTPHDEHPLMGSKFLYLIVQKPRQVDAVRLSLRVAAEVETRHGLFSARTRHQDRERLSTVICGA
jgi:hypothetical protein